MTSDKKDADKPAILMVMLDPPEGDEQEFHDWYDYEHVPERARVDGFVTLQRYVCLEGWPRYMALYDLRSLDVLRSAAYRAIAGENFSPWSKRVIAKVRGWTRTEAVLAVPGPDRTGASGHPLRLAVLRIRDLAQGHEEACAAATRKLAGDGNDVLQTRLFRSSNEPANPCYALIELATPRRLESFNWADFKLPSGAVDIANIYSRYWRSE